LGKETKTHFLTAYLEYLLEQGIKYENDYLGDASRFLRFLLRTSGPEDVQAFLDTAGSEHYRRRLAQSLRLFYTFAAQRLDIPKVPLPSPGRAGRGRRSR